MATFESHLGLSLDQLERIAWSERLHLQDNLSRLLVKLILLGLPDHTAELITTWRSPSLITMLPRSSGTTFCSSSSSSTVFTAFVSSLGRIPVRLYVRSVGEDIEDIEDTSAMDSWDRILYINRPVEIHREGGCNITLESAMRSILPEIFEDEPSTRCQTCIKEGDNEPEGTTNIPRTCEVDNASTTGQQEVMASKRAGIKLIRIHGIELDSQIPFHWVINNLKHPEYYLHICVFVGSLRPSRAR